MAYSFAFGEGSSWGGLIERHSAVKNGVGSTLPHESKEHTNAASYLRIRRANQGWTYLAAK